MLTKIVAEMVAPGEAEKLFSWSDHVDFYTTPYSGGELATTLPLQGDPVAVLSIGPIHVTSNDLIVAFGEAEFSSNEATSNVLIASSLILASAASDFTAISGGEITESNGRNITPNTHHETQPKIGGIRSPIDSTQAYVNYIARADSSSGTLDVIVEQDYGRLSVLIFKNFYG